MKTTERYSEWYEVRGLANFRRNPEVEVTLTVGMVRGMTDNGAPGWTEYSGIHFLTSEEALEYLPSLHWNYINLRDIHVVKRTQATTIVDTEERV